MSDTTVLLWMAAGCVFLSCGLLAVLKLIVEVTS